MDTQTISESPRMNEPAPPIAALDNILHQAQHLLIDFDGPICTLFPRFPALPADYLRALLTAQGIQFPEPIATTADPLAVLTHATTIRPELAAQAEAELTEFEVRTVPTAQPTGDAHDLITSARESGRTVTIISTCSASAVSTYLAHASLADPVGLVQARTPDSPGAAYPELIRHAISELATEPGACAILAESEPALQGAKINGANSIACTRTAPSEPTAATRAGTATASLADLAVRLRATPLPD